MAAKRNLVDERAAKMAKKNPVLQAAAAEQSFTEQLDGIKACPSPISAEGWVMEFDEYAQDWAVEHKDAAVAEIMQHLGGVFWYVAGDVSGVSIFKKETDDQGEQPLYIYWLAEIGWVAAQKYFTSKAEMEQDSGMVAAWLGGDDANPTAGEIHIPYWASKKVKGGHLDSFHDSCQTRNAIVNTCVLKQHCY